MIGVGLLAEASSPFVAIKNILRLAKIRDEGLALINLILLAFTYFVVRIVPFFVIISVFAAQNRMEMVEAFLSIPFKCQFFLSIMMVFQIYWFSQILKSLNAKFKKKLL